MATLATQNAALAGAIAYTAANAGGDKFEASSDIAFRIKTTGTVSTVTFASPGVCSQGGTHPLVVTMAATEERLVGPFPAQRFAAPSDGLVAVTYSSVVGLTVAVERV
jgi:hypothetical protein